MCGFMNSIFVTVPVSVTGLLSSNSTLNPWCATTGDAAKSADARARDEKKELRMNSSRSASLRSLYASGLPGSISAADEYGLSLRVAQPLLPVLLHWPRWYAHS